MGERPEQFPLWYDPQKVAECRELFSKIAEKRKLALFFERLVDFKNANPDAHDYFAFHILIGSGIPDLNTLHSFDYPDGRIMTFARARQGEFEKA